jgi:hypothetical protein
MRNLKYFESFSSNSTVSKSFTKNGKNYDIIYTGDKDPDKDGFLIHTTGYDSRIGNEILGFFDYGTYKEATSKKNYKEGLKKLTDKYERKNFTSGFIYCNANDVIDFYMRCCKEMDEGMIKQYRERIKPFGFDIIEK